MSMEASPASGAIKQHAAAVPWSLLVAGSIVGIWIVLALFAPLVAPFDPTAVDIANALKGPSAAHWFGTDQVGRDVLSRVIHGARIDLLMCLAGVLPPLLDGKRGWAFFCGANSMPNLAGFQMPKQVLPAQNSTGYPVFGGLTPIRSAISSHFQ